MIAAILAAKRWMRLAMPDDVAQEVELSRLLAGPGATETTVAAILEYRLRLLRRYQWDRTPGPPIKTPACLRPSKRARAGGYRKDSGRKRSVRLAMDADRRAEIAAKGAQARWNAETFSARS